MAKPRKWIGLCSGCRSNDLYLHERKQDGPRTVLVVVCHTCASVTERGWTDSVEN